MSPLSTLRSAMRRFLFLFGLLALLAGPARATWSIVVVDDSTGEVCVACATCIAHLHIAELVPVVVVGKGGGVSQLNGDSSGATRVVIRDGLLAGDAPADILAALQAMTGYKSKQYGLVSLYDGAPVGYTGPLAGDAWIDLVGEVGSIRYAMQGNVLAGREVILQAERTFLTTEGDLVSRVMAAMESARSWGGDGRCSCSFGAPTNCGCPPDDFTFAAYTASIVVARMGDTDGPCDGAGCVEGDYYFEARVAGYKYDPPPVLTLTRMYDHWRERLCGVPDHVLTEVDSTASRLPADGLTSTEVELRLVDLDGVPLDHGGQSVVVTEVSGGGSAVAGAVVDRGDGTHAFPVTAMTSPGTARFRIEVTQGSSRTVRLYPDLVIEVDPPAELHVGHAEVSAAVGARVPLVVDLGATEGGQPYRLLFSAAGTHPGTPYGGLTIPLNSDRFFRWSFLAPPTPIWSGNHGNLDASGRAVSLLTLKPEALTPFQGGRLDFCALLPGRVTAPAGFSIVP